MAHAQTHVARGDDSSSGKEPVLAPKCGGRCPGPTTQNKYKSCFLKKCVGKLE